MSKEYISKNIVLIGMSGSGKTVVGQFLSKKLNMKLIDTDDIIVLNSKKTIPYIFSQYGEKKFRDLESKVIDDLSSETGIIISTGGGVVLNKKNIYLLKKKGVLFFLKANMDTLVKNIESSSQTHRPLLENNKSLGDRIRNIYKKRKELYISSADYIVKVDRKSVEEIGEEIIYILNK